MINNEANTYELPKDSLLNLNLLFDSELSLNNPNRFSLLTKNNHKYPTKFDFFVKKITSKYVCILKFYLLCRQ